MRDGEHSAVVSGKVRLEPLDAFGVEMVGGFIEQQQVRLLEEQLAQRDPAPLTAGEDVDR